jgi:hypothetical protein
MQESLEKLAYGLWQERRCPLGMGETIGCETCRVLADLLDAAEVEVQTAREEHERIKAELERHSKEQHSDSMHD